MEVFLVESIGLIASLVALTLSVVSFMVSSRVLRLHSTERVTSAFNELLLSAMSDSETRAALHMLMLPDQVNDDDATKRQRLIAYYILNTLQHSFLAHQGRLMDPGEADPILSTLLQALLRSDAGSDALERGSYHPAFKRYARSINGVMKS
jgi:hypothetical protein